MNIHFSIYAVPALISAAVMLYLFLYCIHFRRNAPGAWQFTAITTCGWLWAIGQALSLMLADIHSKTIWFNLAQVGPDFATVFWLLLDRKSVV